MIPGLCCPASSTCGVESRKQIGQFQGALENFQSLETSYRMATGQMADARI